MQEGKGAAGDGKRAAAAVRFPESVKGGNTSARRNRDEGCGEIFEEP